MSSSILEQIRFFHEKAEIHEKDVSVVLDEPAQGQKAKVLQQHKIAHLVNEMILANSQLKSLYADENGAFNEEITSMRGPQMFGSFYEALNSTRDYHQRFPNLQSSTTIHQIHEIPIEVSFSGEEVFGKYLDLHELFQQYCNLPSISSADHDYLQYLDKFNSFFYIPESSKGSKQYRQYVENLLNYLTSFFNRIQPLGDFETLVDDWRVIFDDKWSQGSVPGWKNSTKQANAASHKGEPQPLRLGMFNSSSELEALGMDRLKEALEALGLKCGGTLRDRAERLWQVRGKKSEDIPEKLKAKSLVAGSKRKMDSEESTANVHVSAADSRQKQVA